MRRFQIRVQVDSPAEDNNARCQNFIWEHGVTYDSFNHIKTLEKCVSIIYKVKTDFIANSLNNSNNNVSINISCVELDDIHD